MPAQTSPPLPAAYPSFMSVFGGNHQLNSEPTECDISISTTSLSNRSAASNPQTKYPLPSAYTHRGSITSVGTDSADSSPTTTVSTFDTASVTASTDPSPSSSPESPTSAVPVSPFKSISSRPRTSHAGLPHDTGTKTSPPSSSSLQLPDSPASKARNVKKLSLNVLPSVSALSSTSPCLDSSHPLSAPPSPMQQPSRTGRKKPTNLTIQTPGFDKINFAGNINSIIPPTPAGRPSLRQYESSPALPSVLSPKTAPRGGMQFPPTPALSRLSQPGSERSSFSHKSSISENIQEISEEESQDLKSKETTEKGYTSGPVCIYEAGLYLYLEPSEEEASNFDVVVNVAKEVKCPFQIDGPAFRRLNVSVWRNPGNSTKRQTMSEPQTATAEPSLHHAFEWPTAVQPSASTLSVGPEYIHVPWDHNSEILEDLFPLCELIESRIKAGKTVLVHCQLGVSRSASLVIAYGLYTNQCPDFHSMYTYVKERSRWVGPNMSLIYQLMDFRARTAKVNKAKRPEVTANAEADEVFSDPDITPKGSTVSSSPAPMVPCLPKMVSSGTQTDFEPYYSKSPPREISNGHYTKPLPPIPSSETPSHTQSSDIRASSPIHQSPSPPSAKSSKRSRPLPLREKPRAQPSSNVRSFRIPPHVLKNIGERPTVKVVARPIQMDLVMQDVPSTPSLLSPRATEFIASPFPRSSAGDLLFSPLSETVTGKSFFGSGPKVVTTTSPEDPRSPPQANGINEIVLSIDELL